MHVGGNSVEYKTEASNDDVTECSHSDTAATGLFVFFMPPMVLATAGGI